MLKIKNGYYWLENAELLPFPPAQFPYLFMNSVPSKLKTADHLLQSFRFFIPIEWTIHITWHLSSHAFHVLS